MLLLQQHKYKGLQIIEAILSFNEIHTLLIQNSQNYNYRQPTIQAAEDELSFVFATGI